MTKVLSQLSLFEAATEAEDVKPSSGPQSPAGYSAGVGFRIKSLKPVKAAEPPASRQEEIFQRDEVLVAHSEEAPVRMGMVSRDMEITEEEAPVRETVTMLAEEVADEAIEDAFEEEGQHTGPAVPENVVTLAEEAAVTRQEIKPKSRRGRKSLKQITAEADLIEIPADEILFSKLYYTMREVAHMFHVNQSLLRYWETEFDILQPRKNKKGDRYFRPVDIKNLHFIYHLLRQRKYTIEGAKEFLKNNKKAEDRWSIIQRLQEIRSFLLEMKAQL